MTQEILKALPPNPPWQRTRNISSSSNWNDTVDLLVQTNENTNLILRHSRLILSYQTISTPATAKVKDSKARELQPFTRIQEPNSSAPPAQGIERIHRKFSETAGHIFTWWADLGQKVWKEIAVSQVSHTKVIILTESAHQCLGVGMHSDVTHEICELGEIWTAPKRIYVVVKPVRGHKP